MISKGWTRIYINHNINRIRRVLKWATAEELIPPAVLQACQSLSGLRQGRTEAKESAPVIPVAPDLVQATISHLPHHVAVMVELMLHTGMRPAEVCGMTLNQIERTGKTWVYRPRKHKTAHHGKHRSIPLGPLAKDVLVRFLDGRVIAPDAPIFSPRLAREERFAAMRATRKSRVQPSQVNRKKGKPKRLPAPAYTPNTISHAIAKACEKHGLAHWHPYQLRHTFATRVRREHGLEAAQVLLGHSRADVTQVYAERDEQLALQVAAKIG